MSGRQITDQILIANESVENFKRDKKKGVVCKLDLEKAYDFVDWDFLREVLTKFGFGARWCKWIMGCVRNYHYSMLVNGTVVDFFPASRGIRQGDPLSPCSF